MTPSEKIRFLKKQLNKERRKNRLLRERLQKRGIHVSDLSEDAPDSFLARANEAHLFRHRGYGGYLAELIRRNSVYRVWEKYVGYFRRLGLVSATFRIITYILVLVQTGTVFFVAFVCFLIALPIFTAISLGTYLVANILVRRDNRRMSELCGCEHIYVFFPAKTQEFSRGNFWKRNVLLLAKRENSRVIIVSPYFFSGKGLSPKGHFYFNFRKETDRVYWIRKHYFFSLRRHVLSRAKSRVILIY